MPAVDGKKPSILGVFGALNSTYVTVHQNRCVVVRNKNANCMKCADACTSDCITYEDNHLNIEPSRCVGCGTCATVCPSCALEAHNPSDSELVSKCEKSKAANGGKIVISCIEKVNEAKQAFKEDAIVLTVCLGRIEESVLLKLVSGGARDLTLVHGDCENCQLAPGMKTCHKVIETTKVLLDTWEANADIKLQNEFPDCVLSDGEGAELSLSEESFEEIREEKESRECVAKYLRVMADGTLPHFIPDRRERLLDALADLGEPKEEKINTRLWGHIKIDLKKCVGCKMCTVFCPTGALAQFVEEKTGTDGIEHRPSDCVKCCCCRDICLGEAIEMEDEIYAPHISSGEVERYYLPARTTEDGGPHSILRHISKLLDDPEIYER